MKKTMVIFSMFMLLSVVSFSQEPTPKVNERQRTQQSRIQQGKQNSELTHRETSLLRKEQKHIRRSERRAKTDGDVTASERRRLDRQQDRASRHIHKAKNNEVKPN
jgi:hypothetical protein